MQKGLHEDLPQLVKKLRAAGTTVSLDTNDDPDDRWDGVLDALLEEVDVLLPNEAELKRICKRASLEEALEEIAGRVPLTIVKCGRSGAILQQGSRREQIPGFPVEAVDTIGAGDSFDAGFLHAWLGGCSAATAVQFGNLTGALSTQGFGGTEAFRRPAAIHEFLERYGSHELMSLLKA